MNAPVVSPAESAADGEGAVLRLRDIRKQFLGVAALKGVQLTLRAGEIHTLMGQNGAGKSTLIKVLTGVYPVDGGEMVLGGQPIRPASPLQAQQLGISTVYQEVNLCPNLSVAENVFAGRYPRRGWLQGRRIDWAAVHRRTRELLARLDVDIDVTRLLSSYPVAVQQMVAIARALSVSSKVLILDEPTSSLDEDEVNKLFEVLRRLRGEGLAILFVTHFLNQVYAVSDRITVLRNGNWVGEWKAADLPPQALISAMVGREWDMASAATAQRPPLAADAPVVLSAEQLAQRGQLQATDLQMRAGEVVGLAGLLGSGRTELARLLFGLAKPDGGQLRIAGEPAQWSAPADAVRRGLAMCPEERKTEGIVSELSLRENIALALQASLGLRRNLSRAEQTQLAERFVKALGIKTPSVDTPIGLLSGGNQQKAMLARWLATNPRLLLLDEPTRGIDVAAKQEIMDEILRLAASGMSVLFISSEMNEVVRVSHRIAVLRDRRKVGELPEGSKEDAVYDLIASQT